MLLVQEGSQPRTNRQSREREGRANLRHSWEAIEQSRFPKDLGNGEEESAKISSPHVLQQEILVSRVLFRGALDPRSLLIIFTSVHF